VVQVGAVQRTTGGRADGSDREGRRSVDYEVISADSHVVEPHDLWRTGVEARYRDRAPRLVHEGATDRLVCDEAAMPPVGLLAGCARGDDEVRAEGRWDDDVPASGYEPTARLRDVESDGVDAEVLFPTIGMHLDPIADEGLQWALFRAYNSWLAAFCAAAPERFKAVAMLTAEDADLAVAEMERGRSLGHVGIMLPLIPGGELAYHQERYDPVWRAAVDLAMPVNLHTSTTRDTAFAWDAGSVSTNWVLKTMHSQRVLLDLVFRGLFDRFPELRVVSVESDAGWAGNVVERADFWWRRNRKVYAGGAEAVCVEPPSAYFGRNIKLTYMRDRTAVLAHEVIGADTMMWSTDFPHHVSTWPSSRSVLDEQFAGQDPALRHQVVCGNVRQLYGF
jgi:predicted TIM-barrel fold metal-dependent hydrolase